MTETEWNNLSLEEKEKYIGFDKGNGRYALVGLPEHSQFIFKNHLIDNGEVNLDTFFENGDFVCGGISLDK